MPTLPAITWLPPVDTAGLSRLRLMLLRGVYFLMAAFMARDAWTVLLQHRGSWDPLHATAFCVWAAYGTLAVFGLRQPVRLLPLVVFMVFYKTLWLAVVAWPLWQAGTLVGSPAEELTWVYGAAPLIAAIVPWRVALRQLTGAVAGGVHARA